MSTDVNLSKDDRDALLDAIQYWLQNNTQEEPDDPVFDHMRRLEKRFMLLTPWRQM